MLLRRLQIGAAAVLMLSGPITDGIVSATGPTDEAGLQAAPTPSPPDLREFDAYVKQAMRQWGVPGVAIAVVKDDTVLLASGYGRRKTGSDEPVTEHTLFAIGSCTKAFTATALALLVAEGKLQWDTPVIRYMPAFRVSDAYVTQNATVRDLLTNRSGAPGLEAGEVKILFGPAASRQEVLQRLAELPGWDFRSRFDYSNGMYLAAGEIIPAVTGTSYDDFIRERIFRPLGMSRSNTSTTVLPVLSDVATPHARQDGDVRTVAWRNIDNIAPAGSINSSVAEMAQWLRLQLGDGRIDGRQLVTSAALAETHRPAVVVPRNALWARMFPGVDILTWGMGWTISEYRGVRVIEHAGIIDGMHALVGLMPSHRLGIVVLSNLDFASNQFPEALRYRLYDTYLGEPARDWSSELLRVR